MPSKRSATKYPDKHQQHKRVLAEATLEGATKKPSVIMKVAIDTHTIEFKVEPTYKRKRRISLMATSFDFPPLAEAWTSCDLQLAYAAEKKGRAAAFAK